MISNSHRKRLAREHAAAEAQRSARASEGNITAFRREEMHWKTRTISLNLAQAFTRQNADHLDSAGSHGEVGPAWTDRNGRTWSVRLLLLQGDRKRKAVLFDDLPGLIYLPCHYDDLGQRELMHSCLFETTGPASRSNLDTHYESPEDGWWLGYIRNPNATIYPRRKHSPSSKAAEPAPQKRKQVDLPPMDDSALEEDIKTEETKRDALPSSTVQPACIAELVRKLRWTILGLEYHWGTKSYKWKSPRMPMPNVIREACKSIVRSIPWATVFAGVDAAPDYRLWTDSYEPEAGVVNFYQDKDSLTAHVDQSEVDTNSPLVSISLGESAIFLIGGRSRDDPPVPLLLQSGDAIIMSGPSRRVFHGVPRILQDSLPTDLLDGWDLLDLTKRFMSGTRININVRQVYANG